MRKLLLPFYLFTFIPFLASCGGKHDTFLIEGTFKGFNQGELYIYGTDGSWPLDTIGVAQGKFRYAVPIDAPTVFVLVFPNFTELPVYGRQGAEKKFLERFPEAIQNSVKLVVDEYNPEDYFTATNVRSELELQTEPEKGERCRRCYQFRMKRAWEYACKEGFDWFTTTLSISPHKDSEKINVIGKELEEAIKTNDSLKITPHTKFLPSDFKKKGGFLRSTQLSEEYGLWRQDYCGCVYSMRKD